MKAYQIMMVLLLFNGSIVILQAASIYTFGLEPLWLDYDTVMLTFLGALMGLLGGTAIVSIVSKTKVAMEQVVYVLFSGIFWSTFFTSMSIFDGILAPLRPLGVSFLFNTLFLVLGIIIFTVGIMQVVVGGWKSYE